MIRRGLNNKQAVRPTDMGGPNNSVCEEKGSGYSNGVGLVKWGDCLFKAARPRIKGERGMFVGLTYRRTALQRE